MDRPEGVGELILQDGSVHVGMFEGGAASGQGVYYDRSGAVHTGQWCTLPSMPVQRPAGP
ncbi:MAG: hypothetical protein SGPRY_000809 [Prymnesium sp.]